MDPERAQGFEQLSGDVSSYRNGDSSDRRSAPRMFLVDQTETFAGPSSHVRSWGKPGINTQQPDIATRNTNSSVHDLDRIKKVEQI